LLASQQNGTTLTIFRPEVSRCASAEDRWC
jgi:hypothetical protein